jgi:hypothetical protein
VDDPLHDESVWSYVEFKTNYRGDGAWKQSYLTR